MDSTEILGLAAAFFTTVCNIPQAVKIIKTRETKGVSAITYSALLFGLILWVIYGFMRDDLPLIIANSVSALITATVLFLKLISKKTLEKIHEKVSDNC